MSITAAFMVPHPPLIIPQVGRGGEAQIAETDRAYRRAAAEIAALAPETVIISSPHATAYTDYFPISPGPGSRGSFGRFGAPQVRLTADYDSEFIAALGGLCREQGFPAGTAGEREPELDHGTMVPLYFLRQAGVEARIVRLGLSGLSLADHYRLGTLIAAAAEQLDRRAVYVASGDLSHRLQPHGPYGWDPAGPEYDRRLLDACGRAAFGELLDFDEDFCQQAAECGHRSFVIMAGALDGRAVRAEVFSHQDVTGVGYGVCSFYPGAPDAGRRFLDIRLQQRLAAREEGGDPLVALARLTIESYVGRGVMPELPEGLPPELTARRAGAFVSLHEQGQLRGCIGTIAPTADCLGREIMQNAVSAAVRDPRFAPVRRDELPWLDISVDVLGEAEDIDSPAELDVKRYGVIVSRGGRRGLLLPDLAGVDSVEQQIAIARQKAGIGPEEKVSLQRFEVVRHV